MDTLSKTLSAIPLLSNPSTTVSIKVPRNSLQSAHDNGLAKTDIISRNLAYLPIRRRVAVEAAIDGTSDSLFFVPEQPNVDQSQRRVTPVQFAKIRPCDHDDTVYQGDDFEIEFVGMNITPQDMFGGNDLLLCSVTSNDAGGNEVDDAAIADTEHSHDSASVQHVASREASACSVDEADGDSVRVTSSLEREKSRSLKTPKLDEQEEIVDDEDLPMSLQLGKFDLPFIHYDPILDGHDVGSKPDTFVPIPGTKRLYLQRKGKFAQDIDGESPVLYMRFTVMEVDKLSEEQIAAIKSIEMIGKSVSNAASSVPYLKIISFMLKFANYLGKSALKKVSQPDHVLSVDITFKVAQRPHEDTEGDPTVVVPRPRQEEYGNYLRYGYYFFLGKKVDARLYAQTGSSSQSIALLMKRQGYSLKLAQSNEKEYFPLTGVSYVVVKVTRGCSPMRKDRADQAVKHRERLKKLLQKYKGTEAEDEDKKEAVHLAIATKKQ